jgi:hypothetical protein
MKFQLQTLAAAALLATSGLASAAIDSGATGNGELFVIAYDTTSQLTYSFDTGVLMSAFQPTTATSQSFSLDGFSSFLASSSASTVRWGVFAADRVNPTALYTTSLGAVATNPNLSRINNINSALSSFSNAHNINGTHASQANGSATVAATGEAVDFGYGGYIFGSGNNFNANLSFQATGGLNDTLSFYKFTNGTSLNSVRTQFANTHGNSSFSLNANTGTLSYTAAAPVPEPSTYALALAGFGVLGLLARRRNKK